jgi:hypothetical protein
MNIINRKKRLEISSPINFEHRVHSGYDRNNGIFIDLPAQWNSIISKIDIDQKPKLLNISEKNTNCFHTQTDNSKRAPIIENVIQKKNF